MPSHSAKAETLITSGYLPGVQIAAFAASLQAAATTWEELKALQPQVEETNFASRAASNLIRGDLGLSGSPTCDEVNSEP